MHQLPIKIVFPTLEEVQRSDFGTKGGCKSSISSLPPPYRS